jgi:hypothetical protein
MTVPQDILLCGGLGVAAHLIPAAGAQLGPRGRVIASVGLAIAWVPVTSTLLSHWLDWSWWYWEPVEGNLALSLGLGITLELAAWFLGLYGTIALARRSRLKLLGVLGVIYSLALVLPWPLYSKVGTAAQVREGTAPMLWEASDLMVFLVVAGAWLGIVLGSTAWKLRKTTD